MKLNQLRNLIAVAEAGSVRQAARDINLSQSALTKSIQQLEDTLGVELLHRESHGVRLTAAGESLLTRAKTVDAELRHARSDIELIKDTVIGEIRISASPSVSVGLVARAVAAFKADRPQISFRIDEAVYPEILGGVRSGDTDFAICLLPERLIDDTLKLEFLVRDRLSPAVRVGHPLTEKPKISLRELAGREWVTYRRTGGGRDIFGQTFIANGLETPKQLLECSSFAGVLALLSHTDLIGLLPRQIFANSALAGQIVPLTTKENMPAWNVGVIYRSNHKLSAASQAFLAQLKESAQTVNQVDL
jgi:molybdate transport repressor ModE-like protein